MDKCCHYHRNRFHGINASTVCNVFSIFFFIKFINHSPVMKFIFLINHVRNTKKRETAFRVMLYRFLLIHISNNNGNNILITQTH